MTRYFMLRGTNTSYAHKPTKDIVGQIIGQNIRRLRIQAGYTQRQLGKLCGTEHQNISAVERGRGIGAHLFEKIKTALNCTEGELLVPLVGEPEFEQLYQQFYELQKNEETIRILMDIFKLMQNENNIEYIRQQVALLKKAIK